MNNNHDIKLPISDNWKLFLLICTCLIHILSVLFTLSLSAYLFIIVLINSLFYFLFRNRIKIFVHVMIISGIIFIVNSASYEGNIVFELFFLKFSRSGIDIGARRSILLFLLFLISSNTFYKNKDFIISVMKKSNIKILGKTFHYFFSLINILHENKNNLIKKFIFIYYDRRKNGEKEIEGRGAMVFYTIGYNSFVSLGILLWILFKYAPHFIK